MADCILVPEGTQLVLARYAEVYGSLPPVVGPVWRDMGCLGQFTTAGSQTINKVRCLGKTAPIGTIRGESESTISVELKCLDPHNFATAFGGGEYVPDPSGRPGWFQFRKNKGAAPLVGLGFMFTNAEAIDDGVGGLMNPGYEMVWPKAQVTSAGEFNGGVEGSGEEISLNVTFEILAPDADATHNPDGLDFLKYTNHPAAAALVGDALV